MAAGGASRTPAAAEAKTADRRGRALSKSQRGDISWALQQNPGIFAHGITVHGVYINYRHEGRREVDTHGEKPGQRKMRNYGDSEAPSENADKAMRKLRKVSVVRKGRAERYGHAMHFLKGMVFRRWLGFVVQCNLNPAKLPPPALLPPGQEQHGQQRMDDDRAPKRPHETPVRAQREPRSPGGTTYAALVLAGLGSSSTESTPAARPAKTRSTGSSSASERSGQG
jgi:hypothetical protein